MTATEERLDAWTGFRGEGWRREIDVRGFVQDNYTPYEGDAGFLAGPTPRTAALWRDLSGLFAEVERVDVLPFHKLGAPKYAKLGTPFALAGTPTPTAVLVSQVRSTFIAHGLNA
ncbi:hypothetical protein ABZ816_31275 [Actinosynnema sp. NPDC047251]|uniref:Formate C-acetyltransferase n=1 Tax=Saccharothrix espanaensis (strain ATCC 51144 / DSM 44229 / JCM 9112 / NBRC 15066 / NRRL 15764) TaxID=1179773 RepID=K0K7K2_SACES|nr:hypothetical protein [Saccharothrix espanaensis]CCH32874.1 hypothetical protein BN6_56150 [Saccharothrix espanaensis DSM 44229]